jgi:hypothetical protein
LEGDFLFRRAGFGVGFFGSIEACHIGLVVLFVVQGHDFLGNVWLQGLRLVKTRYETGKRNARTL